MNLADLYHERMKRSFSFCDRRTIPCAVHPRWSVHISALSSYSPPAAPAWLHPPPLPPPASGIPRSGRWSSWSPAADAVSCWRCCCICLWEDRNSQSTSAGQLRSSGPLACFTWVMQTSDTRLHLTQIQAKTPFKSAIELKYTLLERQKTAHNNRDTYGMRFSLLKTLKSMDLNDLLSILWEKENVFQEDLKWFYLCHNLLQWQMILKLVKILSSIVW